MSQVKSVTPDYATQLAAFLNTGRVEVKGDRLYFDGRLMAEPGKDNSAVPALEYDENGWSTFESPPGGRRSQRVDKIVQALMEKYPDIAERIPAFFIATFSAPSGGIGQDTPQPFFDMTKAKTDADKQRIANIVHLHGAFFGQGIGNSIDVLEQDYRGVGKGSVPRAMIGNDQNAATQRPWTAYPDRGPATQAFDLDTRYQNWTIKRVPARLYADPMDSTKGDTPDAYAAYDDHAVLDTSWDTRTDEPLGNQVWSWVQSLGVNLPAPK